MECIFEHKNKESQSNKRSVGEENERITEESYARSEAHSQKWEDPDQKYSDWVKINVYCKYFAEPNVSATLWLHCTITVKNL